MTTPMIGPPTHPDLLALLRGELDNAAVFATADHLDNCESCRQELTMTATGHALVTGSARTLGSLANGPEAGPEDPDRRSPVPPLPPVPDLAGIDRRRRRNRVVVGLVAATVAGLVGTGGYFAGNGTDSDNVATPPASTSPENPSPSPITRTAILTPVEGSAGGTVSMTDQGDATAVMRIETDLRPARPGQFYYAWLLDPVTNKMLPLGQVGPGGAASFEVSQALLAAYSAVDVSLETDDGDPGHSPRSVLRAVYA